MDLLDLTLDLNVDNNTAPTPVTRRSQASRNAKGTPTTSTPKTTVKKTPKKTTASATKATPKAAPEKTSEAQESSESPSVSRETSTDRNSRSMSTDKRSRNKAKKRFSPSPEAPNSKKRKVAPAAPATSAPETSETPKPPNTPKKSNMVKLATGTEFAESLARLGEILSQKVPTDFDIPEDWKKDKDDTSVEQMISKMSARSTDTTDKAAESPAPIATPSKNASKSSGSSAKKKMAPKQKKERSFSRELGVEEDFKIEAESTPSSSTAPEAAQKKRNSRKSALEPIKEVKKEVEVKVKEEEKSPPKRTSTRKPRKSVVAESTTETAEPKPDPNETPKSAPATRQRLLGGTSFTPPVKKNVAMQKVKAVDPEVPIVPEVVEEVEKEAPPPPPPVSVPETPEPKKAPPPAVVLPPTRSSGRVSKPNRLYADQDFNTEIIGRVRVNEQNPVKEAQAREATPELFPSELPSTSSASRPASQPRKKAAPKEVVPKPIPIVNGVFRGYIPSVKRPLEDIEVDGEVVKLNEVVTETMDTLLLKVCKDGVEQHENIDAKIWKAKKLAKVDLAKRIKQEAKKLDIQMRIKIPNSSDELGKRKRNAPRTGDFYWTPPVLKTKLSGKEGQEEGSPAPVESSSSTFEERKQQRARESLSHQFDAEMDATIKEAKTYSVSFDKYIKPKISAVQQKTGVKLMSRKRQTAVSDDFYYHELLTDQLSPSTSNVENEEEFVDVDGMEEVAQVAPEVAIGIRTDALDIAEQIAVLLPRPTQIDGSPMEMDEIRMKTLEQPETRRTILHHAFAVVLDQLAHEMAPATREPDEQGCMWHTVTSTNAQRLKNVYTISSTDREDSVTWAHQFLVEHVPVHVLASYLSVVRYARRINPSRFGFIVNSTDQLDAEWTQATALLRSFVYKRGVEPGTEVLNNTIPYHRMADTVFLLVSPTMAFGEPNGSQLRPRHHGRIFRWLQSIGHLDSETIGFSEEVDASCSVAEYISDVVIETICEKVRQKARDRPHCKLVLVGYGPTTYLVHRAANLVGGISAIISIGFPVMTKFGRRGTPDDDILLTYCPTLFIVGAEGYRFDNKAMTELRSSIVASTGLVVVGHANDLLLVPPSIMLRLGISQTVVFRMVLEKILDFLNLEAVRQQDAASLTPIELNNVYNLDSALLKSDKALSGLAYANATVASPIGSGRRATVIGSGDDLAKKKRNEPIMPPSQSSFHGSLPAPSPRADERFLAFQNLVASTVATADDLPRRASIGASPRGVERGDFRDRSRPGPSPLPPPLQPAQPRGPVDPASISLN